MNPRWSCLPELLVCVFFGIHCGCAGAGLPFLEIRYARVDGDRLSMVVDSHEVSALDQVINVRQYLVRFKLSGPDAIPEHLGTSEFAIGDDGAGYFVVNPRGNVILLIRGLGLTVIDGKVYSIAALRVLSFEEATGKWIERRAWDRVPFFVDRDVTRLLVREERGAQAYSLPACQSIPLDGVNDLFASIGSSWDTAPEHPPMDGMDSPPDYAGLTAEFDYASADGGLIFAKFIYEHAERQWRRLPRPVQVPNHGQVYVHDVERNGDQWEFLCLRFGPLPPRPTPDQQPPGPLGLVVVTEDMKTTRGAIAPSHEVREFLETTGVWWDVQGRAVLSYDVNHNAARHGPIFLLGLWRYGGDDQTRIIPITIDSRTLFRVTDDGLMPGTRAAQ